MQLAGLAQSIGDVVESEIRDHEERLHTAERPRLPAPNTAPLTAIPFPDYQLTDAQLRTAIELLSGCADEALDVPEVATRMGVPVVVLERHLAEYRPRWRRFLWERAVGRY